MKKTPAKPKRSSKEKLNETCVIYARYSSHNQKDMSIEQQVALAREMAADLGLTVLEVYADRAISGRSDNRPSFQKMLKDAAKGGFRYVISWKSSRIGRNMLEAMLNEARLADYNVRILYVEEDFEDNAAGRFAVRQRLSSLPEGFRGDSFAAAIHFSPNGRALLISNRGHDSIAAYRLRKDGLLDGPVLSPCVRNPRDFLILGETVVAGSQQDDLIKAYTLNEETLALEETPFSAAAKSPVCFARQ